MSIAYYFVHSSTHKYVEGTFLFNIFFEYMPYVKSVYFFFIYPPYFLRTIGRYKKESMLVSSSLPYFGPLKVNITV